MNERGSDEVVRAQAPGKLYIAGEYAVVEPGYPAIIVALNQFVTVTVEKKDGYGSIVSKQYQENSLMWQRDGDEMVFDNRDNPFHYILSAIKMTESYAREQGKRLELYKLFVDSDLDSADGKKYGLGSSAAVTVATVKALNLFYDLRMTNSQIYKLSAIAHLDIQGNGSLGDIAASVYGGWIAYRSFDKSWLAAERREHSLSELLDMDWPLLQIDLLTAPAEMSLLIGWTGAPASTSRLVDKIAIAKVEKETQYREFLAESKAIILSMIHGFKTNSLSVIQSGIRDYRDLLTKLAQFSGVEIETPALIKLCQIAEKFGGAAKSSGAGGGDCGIVLADSKTPYEQVAQAWRQNGIQPLMFAVHQIRLVSSTC